MAVTEQERRDRKAAYMRAWYAKNKERLKANGAHQDRKRKANREYMRRWSAENRHEKRRRDKEFRLRHPGLMREYSKAAYAKRDKAAERERQRLMRSANPEHFNEYQRRRYQANIEAERAKCRAKSARPDYKAKAKAYRQANAEKLAEYSRQWAAANRERSNATKKAWLARNPEYSKEAKGRRRALERGTRVERISYVAILKASDGKCGICTRPLDLFGYHFDHIVPLAAGGTHTQDNIQVAHAFCNLAKGAKTA